MLLVYCMVYIKSNFRVQHLSGLSQKLVTLAS